jgi:hypothetical protein
MADEDGQLHVLGLLEQLRAECSVLWGTSSKLYHGVDKPLRELSDPNLDDIPVASTPFGFCLNLLAGVRSGRTAHRY